MFALCLVTFSCKRRVIRGGTKSDPYKTGAGKLFVTCELSSRGQKVRSQRHLYICHIFSSCTVYPAPELQPRVKSFSPCFYEAHTACYIPRTQQAGEKHQLPRRQIQLQILGRRLSNAAFIQSPRYISFIKTNILPDKKTLYIFLVSFCCIAFVFNSQIKV